MSNDNIKDEARIGLSLLNAGLGAEITPKQAMEALSKAMDDDPMYAWSWHCNLAMMAFDAGAPHKEANERAAGFMRTAFGVDTRTAPNSLITSAATGLGSKEDA